MAAMLLFSVVVIVVFVRLGRGEAGSDGGSWMAVEAVSGGGGVVSLVMVYFERTVRSVWEQYRGPMRLDRKHPLNASRSILVE